MEYADAVEKASKAPVEMPDELGDRACDTWETLFVLADLCGEDEGRRVRNVACEIAREGVEESWQEELLSDATDIAVRAQMNPSGVQLNFGSNVGTLHVGVTCGGMYGDCILSTTLHQALTLNPDSQWREFGRSGRPLPQAVMTKTLKGYGVKAPKLKKGGGCVGFPIKGKGSLSEANELYGRRTKKEE